MSADAAASAAATAAAIAAAAVPASSGTFADHGAGFGSPPQSRMPKPASFSRLDTLFGQHHSVTVMATTRHIPLAKELVALAPKDLFVFSEIGWNTFPDATPNIRLDVSMIENRDVLMIIDLDMINILPVLSALYAIPRYLCRTFSVICPYYPTGTMERVEQAGEVATAKSLARLLSTTPNPQFGEPVFYFFDIHALATRFFFSDNVKVSFLTAVDCITREVLAKEPEFAPATPGGRYKAVIAFPDDGAAKRFRWLFPQERFDKTVFVKVRRGDQRFLTFMEGEEHVKDRNLVIVDDICFSGGTLLGAAEELLKKGAASVSMFATHGVFPQQSWKKFLPSTRKAEGTPEIRRFYTTNSCPGVVSEILAHSDEARQFYKILSLAPVIVDAIVGNQVKCGGD
jgi:phosphoribosylpyrophosphate synthetase